MESKTDGQSEEREGRKNNSEMPRGLRGRIIKGG